MSNRGRQGLGNYDDEKQKALQLPSSSVDLMASLATSGKLRDRDHGPLGANVRFCDQLQGNGTACPQILQWHGRWPVSRRSDRVGGLYRFSLLISVISKMLTQTGGDRNRGEC